MFSDMTKPDENFQYESKNFEFLSSKNFSWKLQIFESWS